MATAWSPALASAPILALLLVLSLLQPAGEKCQAPSARVLAIGLRSARPLSARTTLLNLRLLRHLPENLAFTDLVPICKALRKFTLTNDIVL